MKVTKQIKRRAIIFIISTIMFSCGTDNKLMETKSEVFKELSSTKQLAKVNAGNAEKNTNINDAKELVNKLIKNADIEFEVDSYLQARTMLDSIAKEWNAFIMKENEQYLHHKISNTIIFRVPNHSFEHLINSLGNVSGNLIKKNINVYDVSEEYMDLETRIKTKKQIEKRYLAILNTTKSVEEILAVENDIRKLREEIEAKEGRLRYLTSKISYSTITLTVFQQIVHEQPEVILPGFLTKVGDSLVNGWEMILALIIAITNIWPLIIIGIAVYYLFNKRRIKK
jgi:cell division protein FtsL